MATFNRNQKRVRSAPAVTVRAHDIARRAYADWVRHQCFEPSVADWLRAEDGLVAENALRGQLRNVATRVRSMLRRRRAAGRMLQSERCVAALLAQGRPLVDVAPVIVRALCENGGWDFGAMWILNHELGTLQCIGLWHIPERPFAELERQTLIHRFGLGGDLPGIVWACGTHMCVPDLSVSPCLDRAAAALAEGLNGAIGFPIGTRDGFHGVLEFFGRQVRNPGGQLKRMIQSVTGNISHFIQNRPSDKESKCETYDRRIAREIQQGLLPLNMPTLPGLQISARSVVPHFVGGDCFDFVPMPPGPGECLGVLVADAAGHGIAAALLTVQARAYLRAIAMTGEGMGRLLAFTNRCMSTQELRGGFVTAFLMKLDLDTRLITYSSAGHLPGYVLDPQGQTKAVLNSTGMPLGIEADEEYPAASVPLAPGDLVVLVTDGITEAGSPDREEFGMDRALQCVRENIEKEPNQIISVLFAAVIEYCKDRCNDDLTAVVIKVES